MQVEKQNRQACLDVMPRRSLSSAKIMQVEKLNRQARLDVMPRRFCRDGVHTVSTMLRLSQQWTKENI